MSVEQHLPPQQSGQHPRKATPNNRRVLVLLILVCVAPVIASYLAYYFLPPDGRVNYGDLIEPQRAISDLATQPLDGMLPADQTARLALDTPRAPASQAVVNLTDWRGRWLMVLLAPADCPPACQTNLYNMRQVRLTTGKYRDRVQRLWLVSDQADPSAELLTEHQGMVAAHVDRAGADALFTPADGKQSFEHIFLVDPLGNLMMRFPAQANPSRMKKDMIRLLKASRIG